MNEILFHYEKIAPTTWVYLSSLLVIGLFFKFGRVWSVRNLDLVLLIVLAPGVLLVSEGQIIQRDALAKVTVATMEAEREEAAVNVPPAASVDKVPDGQTAIKTVVVPSDPATVTTKETDTAVSPEVVAQLDSAKERLQHGRSIEKIGFLWLLGVSALLLVRLLIDPVMVRRPLLEPNMTTGGLTFSCVSLFVFLMANVIVSRPTADDLRGPISAERLMSRQATDDLERHGPGYALVFMLPSLPTVKMGANLARQRVENPAVRMRRWSYYSEAGKPQIDVDAEYLRITPDQMVELRRRDGKQVEVSLANLSDRDQAFVRKVKAYTIIAKLVAFLSHLAIVAGIIAVGYWHFNNIKMGVGAATLYLMLPYTAQMTGRVDHVLPAALLVWAILSYRRPLASGVFVGLAIGVIYYPLFLLPLWFSFYWQRGLMRFAAGVISVLIVMVLMLAFVSPDSAAFWQGIKEMFGLMPPQMIGLTGIWGLGWSPVYRYPVLAAFITLSGSLAVWPAQKNLGTLISCSAAIMVATQFWNGYGGGLYMGWYLPLFLLTIFRPNLEDRVALSVLGEGWLPLRKRGPGAHVEIAA